MRIFTVNIGNRGRIRSIRRLFGHDVVFRSLPLGGHTLAKPKSIVFARVRYSLFLLGGPLANLLLIALAIPLCAQFTAESAVFWMFAGFMWGNALNLARDLFPMKIWVGSQKVRNDGLVLFTLPFASQETVTWWQVDRFYLEALEAAEQGRLQDGENWLAKGLKEYPDKSWSPHSMACALSQLQRNAEARELYLTLLAKSENNPRAMAGFQTSIAWTDLMLGDPALLAEADHFSKLGVEAFPWDSYTKAIRGSVLVELGNIDEGIRLLAQAIKENDLPSAKAWNACCLAVAMMRTAHCETANEYVEEAKRNDPHCPLLQRTIAELEEANLVR